MRTTEATQSTGTSATRNATAVTVIARAAGAAARPLWKAVEGMFMGYERWRQRQALSRLDDHLLKDIGISRADVEQEITKPFWRE